MPKIKGNPFSKNRVKKAKPKARREPKTANGRMIQKLMDTQKLKGDFRDYVILTGNTLMDHLGSYEMHDDGHKLRVRKVTIVHKRHLAKLLGDKVARNFWRFGVRMRCRRMLMRG